jgi:hypothetical protein
MSASVSKPTPSHSLKFLSLCLNASTITSGMRITIPMTESSGATTM